MKSCNADSFHLPQSKGGLLLLIILLLQSPSKKWPSPLPGYPQEEGHKIAYAGTNRHFQLFDNELSHRVIYIHVDRPQALTWDHASDLSFHKTRGDLNLWLKNLQEEHVDFFILIKRNVDYIEKDWIQKHPEIFIRQAPSIYKINKNALKMHLRSR